MAPAGGGLALPSYLEEHGVPETPADLASHRILGGPASAAPDAWSFQRKEETVTLDLNPHFSTNENEGIIAASIAGLGIATTTGWMGVSARTGGGSFGSRNGRWPTSRSSPIFRWPGDPCRRACLVEYFVAKLAEEERST
jgi:DNA-binding transcriptional LysR family regulator